MHFLDRIAKHPIDEYPRDCFAQLLAWLREGGLAKLRENLPEAIVCLITIIAWAITKIRNLPDEPTTDPTNDPTNIDGPIFRDVDEPEWRELMAEMQTAGGFPEPPPMEGLIQSLLVRRLLALAVSYLISLLEDSDRVEDLAEKVIEWIAEFLA